MINLGAIEVADLVPIHSQEEINPVKEGDYIGPDGLLVCGKCGEPMQFLLPRLRGGPGVVVPAVCKCRRAYNNERERRRQAQAVMRGIQAAGVTYINQDTKNATFNTFKVDEHNGKVFKLAREYVENFPKYRESEQGLIFQGSVGTGKTYTAGCIGNELLRRGYSVISTSFVKILPEIWNSKDEAGYIDALTRPDLLIIDDFGTERNSEYVTEKVYNIIDRRRRRRLPMVLTTNKNVAEMAAEKDPDLQRVYDRIIQVCFPVNMYWESRRIKEGRERFTQMKKILEG